MPDPLTRSLSELLWQHDPNGLVVVEVGTADHAIRVVNPAFCRMFGVAEDAIIGRPASEVLDAEDLADFERVAASDAVIHGVDREYPSRGLFTRKVVFAIPAQGVAAAIFVDLTAEHAQRQEIVKLRQATIAKANEVVQNQMRIAQEIAGLLGETTAETKVSLLKLIEAFGQDADGG